MRQSAPSAATPVLRDGKAEREIGCAFMGDVIFTRRGWMDDRGRMPFAVMSRDGRGKVSYGLEFRECSSKTSCFYSESSAIPMPHEDEVLSLLLGIAIGQRRNTPTTQNKFVGRHNKTFFSGRAHVGYTLKPDHLMNLSAIANYIQMSIRDSECGAVERIYEEYCFIVGNLAYTLCMTVRRLETEHDTGGAKSKKSSKKKASGNSSAAPDLPAKHYVADASKIRIPMMSMDDTSLTALRRYASTPEDAVALVEGIMICCCVRDHSAIEKDRKSVKLRRAMSRFDDSMGVLEDKFSTCKARDLRCDAQMCRAFISMANDVAGVVYIVREGTDDVVDWMSAEYDEVRLKCWRLRHPASIGQDADTGELAGSVTPSGHLRAPSSTKPARAAAKNRR